MTTNAPYYQMRGGPFMAPSNSANAAPEFGPEDDEYDLSSSASITSPLDHLNVSIYAEHPTRQALTDNTLEENHHLAELLEAATTAQTMATNDKDTVAQENSKRKRGLGAPAHDITATIEANTESSNKKQRIAIPTEPHLAECHRSLTDSSANIEASPPEEPLLNDAPAAAVHSATALFRPCSQKTTRKHTRPPMSKLFISLQLSPESFLLLQAEAKAYMLDPKHPERQSCVGNRGKGDTDMVKLRLFNCVRDFLDNGAGEKFFGENVEKPGKSEVIEAARALKADQTSVGEQKLTWPRDGNKILGLVTPLLRRMVTNERQRQYAVETRKGTGKKKDTKERSTSTSPKRTSSNSKHGVEQQLQLSLDPSLGQSPPRSHPTASLLPIEATATTSPAMLDSTIVKEFPTEGQAAPNLSHINVFLTLAARGTRSDIKLAVTRIRLEAPDKHLACYEWDKFLQHVVSMLKQAENKYSKAQTYAVNQEGHSNTANLRGLAAAANALSNTVSSKEVGEPGILPVTETSLQHFIDRNPKDGKVTKASGQSIAPPNLPPSEPASSNSPQSSSSPNNQFPSNPIIQTERTLRSCCKFKTIGPQGWRIVANAKDWHDMLMEKAFAIWADGVCNVVVELMDFPVVELSLQKKSVQHANKETLEGANEQLEVKT